MKIVVTGGAGFVGTHLAKALRKRGHEVVALDNFSHAMRGAEHDGVVFADVRHVSELRQHVREAHVCVHLAAQIHVDVSMTNPGATFDVNVNGTLNVLSLCEEYGVRCIVAFSSEVYGSAASLEPMTEEHPLNARHPYGISKLAADRLAQWFVERHGTPVTILRSFNIFGEGQDDSVSYGSVISKFTRAALTGEPLTVFGDGTQERDYMHVSDAVSAYLCCLDNPEKTGGDTFNFGSGCVVRIVDLAHPIIRLTGSKAAVRPVEPRPVEVRRLCAGVSKAYALGWEPKTPFDTGLRRFVHWYARSRL